MILDLHRQGLKVSVIARQDWSRLVMGRASPGVR